MKYIRTNYLFGEIISHTKLLNGTHLFSIKGLDEILPISEEDFEKCKVADTIEELCDELVIHNPSNDGYFYPKYFVYQNKWENMLKPISDYQKSKSIEIYGAIWTNKGLIYVAKMNDKGELELL